MSTQPTPLFDMSKAQPIFDMSKARAIGAIDADELQRRSLGQARAIAARPIMHGSKSDPMIDQAVPGSFEGHPENVGEYIPATAGEMAGGAVDVGRGNVTKGAHRIIGGASSALLPALPFAAAAAPMLTVRTLAGSTAGQYLGSGAGEALGLSPDQTELAGDIGGIAGGVGGAKARVPTKADIALAFRNPETGDLKTGTKLGSAAAGAGLGYLTGAHGFGEFGGLYAGPKLAEALIPKLPADLPARGIGASLPSAEDFYAAKAKDLMSRGIAQNALDRRAAIAAKAFKPDPFAGGTPTNAPLGNAFLPEVSQGNATPFSATTAHEIPGVNAPVGVRGSARSALSPAPIVTDINTPIDVARVGSEGRPATWRNQRVEELARRGNRQAIAQTALRGEELPPNARYVMGDPDFPRAVYNPRETTRFNPEGVPIRDAANPSIASTAETYSKPREVIRFNDETAPADYRPEEPQEVQIKGITAPQPKQTIKRETIPAVEKYLSPEQITDAEGLINQEVGMMSSADRPGRYYDENPLGEYNPQSQQSSSRGVTSGGRWRGVKSGRDMMPFMSEHPEWGPEQLQKAMRNKDSALYKRAIRAAHDFINRGGGYESEERLGLQSD